jgi:transcriptional regulator with XRE-family HTH domain
MYIGHKIRDVRKALGFSIKQLAEKVGLSYLTLQKIETDKISPSVIILARIAECLDSPISVFLEKRERSIVLIKHDEQGTIDTRDRSMKLIAPKGALHGNATIWFGKTGKGGTINPHRNEGFEFAYVIKGRIVLKYGNTSYEMDEGDVVYYDATELHCHTALESHEYLGIHFSQVTQEEMDKKKARGHYTETTEHVAQNHKERGIGNKFRKKERNAQ